MAERQNHDLSGLAATIRKHLAGSRKAGLDSLVLMKEAGVLLIEAQKQVVNETFGAWLAREFQTSHNWANRLMRLSREWTEIEVAIRVAATSGIEHGWGVKAAIALPARLAAGTSAVPARKAARATKSTPRGASSALAEQLAAAVARIEELEAEVTNWQNRASAWRVECEKVRRLLKDAQLAETSAQARLRVAMAKLAGQGGEEGNPMIRPGDMRRLLGCAKLWKQGSYPGERAAAREQMRNVAWTIALFATNTVDDKADDAAA